MAKNKPSKFGVADDLQYNETQIMTNKEMAQIIESSKTILESVPKEHAEQITKKKPKRADAYRFSLYLDADLGEYVNYIKYKHRKSITDYFNELVRADMENDAEWMQKRK